MLQKIVDLIALIATLAKTDPDDYDEVNSLVEKYETAKAELKQFHGDHEIAAPVVVEKLDELVKVARVVPVVDEGDIDDIIATQDEAKGQTGESDESTVTAEDLVRDNNAADLREIALAEKVDLGDATTKLEIAEKIVEARAAAK